MTEVTEMEKVNIIITPEWTVIHSNRRQEFVMPETIEVSIDGIGVSLTELIKAWKLHDEAPSVSEYDLIEDLDKELED